MIDKRNFLILVLVLGIVGLIYLNRLTTNKLASKDSSLEAALDTTHKFKTSLGNQGLYISTITSDRDNLISLLYLKSKDNESMKDIIDSIKKVKGLQSATSVITVNNTQYIHDIDTSNKKIVLNDTITTKWYDAGIHIKDSKLKLNLTQRDELLLTNSLKDNKGWFTGSTLTSYAISKNPNTQITGLTSISTVVNKRKARIGVFFGPAISINKQGSTSVGLAGGFGLTF